MSCEKVIVLVNSEDFEKKFSILMVSDRSVLEEVRCLVPNLIKGSNVSVMDLDTLHYWEYHVP